MIRRLTIMLAAVIFAASCSEESAKLVPKNPEKKVEDKNTEVPLRFEFRPSADILFVIDNSGSMDVHQQNLSKNIDYFINALAQNTVLDFHVGVVTSDMDNKQSEAGRLYGRSVRFVTPQTPNMIKALQANLKPGYNGSGTEYLFDPIMAALSKPLVDTYNADFYREDAHLAIIFISDAEDHGGWLPEDTWDFLVKLKKGQKDRLVAYGALIPIGDRNCPLDEESNYSYKIFDFILNFARGKWFGLCSPDYGAKLAEIGLDLKKRIESVVYLTKRPIAETINVTYGSITVPNDPAKGWVYDFRRNALLMGPDIDYNSQPQGTKLQISFKYYQ